MKIISYKLPTIIKPMIEGTEPPVSSIEIMKDTITGEKFERAIYSRCGRRKAGPWKKI